MRIIGVTGGTGTGKSTVSSILRNLGARVIDADVIARQIVGKDSNVLEKIVQTFGIEVQDENGELNRNALSSIVFSDKEALEKLNSITHPIIGDRICKLVEEEKNENEYDTIIIDAPIPLNHGFRDISDEVWVITADKEKRIERIMERSNLSREEAINRIKSQMSEKEYLAFANVVIENNGDITELEQRIVKQYYIKPEGAVSD